MVKPAQCDALTPAGNLFTPGATGLGKAVLHRHGNLLWAANIGPVNTFFAAEYMFLTYMPLILQSVSGSVPETHNLKYLGLGEFPELNAVWRVRSHSVYGSSQTITHVICTNVHRDSPEGVLGKTVPGYEVQVTNPESG